MRIDLSTRSSIGRNHTPLECSMGRYLREYFVQPLVNWRQAKSLIEAHSADRSSGSWPLSPTRTFYSVHSARMKRCLTGSTARLVMRTSRLHFRLGLSVNAIAQISTFHLTPKGVESSLRHTVGRSTTQKHANIESLPITHDESNSFRKGENSAENFVGNGFRPIR